MRVLRSLGIRLMLGAVVLVVMRVSWFYSDARFSSFSAFLNGSKDY